MIIKKKKQAVVAVIHMNRDIAEVNSSNSPMLPGSFLYEKEPQYEVRVWDQESTSPNGVSADMEVKSKFKWLLCASTYLTYSKKKINLTLVLALLTVSAYSSSCS